MTEASYYETGTNVIKCTLCPHFCHIKEGKTGSCRVRKNINGILIAENYGQVCSMRFDPIEKKPLYHFYPGRTILSVGSVSLVKILVIVSSEQEIALAISRALKSFSSMNAANKTSQFPLVIESIVCLPFCGL